MNDSMRSIKLINCLQQSFGCLRQLQSLSHVLDCLAYHFLQLQKEIKRSVSGKYWELPYFQITSMITKDYLKLVLLAGVVALPVAYILVNNWLQDYAFHIGIGIWFFFLPVIMIVLIALLTVLYQSLKAALRNPVKNLRTE